LGGPRTGVGYRGATGGLFANASLHGSTAFGTGAAGYRSTSTVFPHSVSASAAATPNSGRVVYSGGASEATRATASRVGGSAPGAFGRAGGGEATAMRSAGGSPGGAYGGNVANGAMGQRVQAQRVAPRAGGQSARDGGWQGARGGGQSYGGSRGGGQPGARSMGGGRSYGGGGHSFGGGGHGGGGHGGGGHH
jgi:hypothetical protein